MLPGNRAPEPTAWDQAGSSSSNGPDSNGGESREPFTTALSTGTQWGDVRGSVELTWFSE